MLHYTYESKPLVYFNIKIEMYRNEMKEEKNIERRWMEHILLPCIGQT